MSKIFLHGIGIANFRGTGPEMQLIGPFSDLNFFVGPNNSGKSTLLTFIAKYLHAHPRSRDAWERKFDALDVRLGKNSSEVKFFFGSQSTEVVDALRDQLDGPLLAHAEKIVGAVAANGLVWVGPHEANAGQTRLFKEAPLDLLSELEWQRIWNKLTNQSGGGLRQHWYPQTISNISRIATRSYPQVAFIPAIRQVGPKDAGFDDFSGKGLIDKLAEFQSPPHDEQEKKRVFERINTFLREVTDSPGATIEVPYDRRHLLVHMDGRVLPLEALGTGIHEVIMIAAFCTMLKEQIVCIEEPEIHLHPLLQRRLIKFLKNETSNQYFVATHSASLIDAEPATIFRVSMKVGLTVVESASSATERFEACRHLGYRASDILQANSIVWVEGPTDRIYLNHWLKKFASDLVEGIDYAVMFYGGRLLSHLTPTDTEVAEFISLAKLNRNTAILIDSDRSSASKALNATKQRVVREIGGGIAWVTAGREIENYLDSSVTVDFLSNKYGSRLRGVEGVGRYDDRLAYRLKGQSSIRSIDKVELARYVEILPADLNVLDLRARVEELALFIRRSTL